MLFRSVGYNAALVTFEGITTLVKNEEIGEFTDVSGGGVSGKSVYTGFFTGPEGGGEGNLSGARITVIKTGGKQYRVQQGDVLRVELLNAEEGAVVSFDQVLLVGEGESITVGAPIVDGATVSATVRKHGRADKVRIIKFRRRKHHKKQQGHRQHFTEVEITGINA